MNDWLKLPTCQGAAVLVTVAQVAGSAPREAGAKMLVTADAQYDTIGGGHLELRACEIARTVLENANRDLDFSQVIAHLNSAQEGSKNTLENNPGSSRLERFSLGPSLGQCCGGVVFCSFELIDAKGWQMLRDLRLRLQQGLASWRLVPLDNSAPALLVDARGKQLAGSVTDGAPDHSPLALLFASSFISSPGFQDLPCHITCDQAGQQWLIDPILPPRAHLFLFGAGHVGAALVRALAELPCTIRWIDEREDLFPPTVPDNVTISVAPFPQDLVAEAAPGTSYLVMTHQHALDQRIAQAILQRDDSGWFGLIGSQTKRALFEHRLRERGITAHHLSKMICPIGLPGIEDKSPAVIAASVAAQLLLVWEKQEHAVAKCGIGQTLNAEIQD